MSTFPPLGPTGLTNIIPSYLFWEYQDDDALQTFVAAQNDLAQDMLNWFNGINLPIYTQLSGSLLDWVANGLYGLYRPTLAITSVISIASYGTAFFGELPYGVEQNTITGATIPVTDDVFQRIITWHRYKGDGYQYSTLWLKRRVHRFLNGPNGIAPVGDNTYDVSVAYSGNNITITIPNNQIGMVFQYCVADGAVQLPFGYNYTVVL